MAQVDTSIAMGFRPIQIPLEESPLNRLRERAEFENSLLKSQEMQRGMQQRNALARINATPGLEIGSPEYLNLVQQDAPDLIEDVLSRQLKRQQLREAQETANLKQKKLEREQLAEAKKSLTGLTSLDQARADIYDGIQSGLLTAEQGEALRAGLPMNEEEFPAWKQRTLLGYLTAEQQLERQDKADNNAYSDYLLATVTKNPDAKILSKAEFIAARNQPSAAAPVVAPAAAPAAAPAVAPAATTPTEDGGLGGVTVSAEGTLLAPGVAELYASGDPRLKNIADAMQSRFNDRVKSQRFTGEFANVQLARQRITELRKQPQTETTKAEIDGLQRMIAGAEKGRGTTVNVGLTQEKEFEKELGKGQAKELLDSRTKAEDARDMLGNVTIGRNILKSGAITGAGADFFVGLSQALKTAGFNASADASANSQAYTAVMANNVGKLIKMFGAGTGLSNADREYAEKMAGGKISLDRKALEKILDIQERAANNVIKRHNQKAKGIKTNIPLEVEMEATPSAPKPKSDIRSKADAILGQ